MSTHLTGDEQFLREVILNSSHGVFAVESSGEVVFSNGVLESCLGLDSAAIYDKQLGELTGNDDVMASVRDTAAGPAGDVAEFTLRDSDGDKVWFVATCEMIEFEGSQYCILWFQEQILGESNDSIETAQSGRNQRSPGQVEEFIEVGRKLLQTRDIEEVAKTGLTAIERVLETDVACIRLVEATSNDFHRVATTETATELLSTYPTFDLNRSLAGRAFRREEPVLDRVENTDVTEKVERTNLHIPLEGRGTLTVFGTETGLAKRDIELAKNLASLIATRLTEVSTATNGSGAPAKSKERHELPLQEVVSAAVDAETFEGIRKQICERLVGTGVYSGAWFVTTDIDGELRAVEASAGETDSPPEGVRLADGDEGKADDDPMRRAIESNTVCLVRNHQIVTDGAHETDKQPEQNEQIDNSVVVPVSHSDRTYGVLVMRLHPGREFNSRVRSELEVLGDIVGLAAYAAESKKLLLSEKVQQLEFEVTDQDCLSVAVSDATDAYCEIEHQTLTNAGNHLCYLLVEGTSPEAAKQATADVETVTHCQVVEADENSCLLEVIKTQSGAEAMMDVGATVRRATAEEGVGTLIVETPLSADVRDVVNAYTNLNPDSRLVAKREIDLPVQTTVSLLESVEDLLTDKQWAVLTAAYYAGYFDWPRANTAEDVANSLEISSATFHQHLRAAERKLLELVCDQEAHVREPEQVD